MFPKIGFLILGSLSWLAGTAASAQEACGVPEEAGPRIEAATPMVVLNEGAAACACGVFPDRAALEGLRIDGRPVEASVDELGRVATFRLPAGLGPGVHTLTGAPEAGYSPDERAELRGVTLTRELKRRRFCRGFRLVVTVHGTEEPIVLRIENHAPALLVFNAGRIFEAQSSGGPKNEAVLRGRTTGSTGRARVHMSLAESTCPCAGARPGSLPPERVAELEACLAEAVSEIEGWFDGRARELADRARRGVLAAGEVVTLIDELEDRFLRVLATPDLAALRAWVEDELAREREVWSRAPAGPVPAAARPASGSAPAGGGPGHPPSIVRAQAEASIGFSGFWERITSFFERLDEVSNNLVVDLCVRSDPLRRSAWVQPKRYAEGRRVPQTTHTEFLNLTRGIYVGRVEDSKHPARFEVDLVKRYRIYVQCDLGSSPPCDSPVRPANFECRPEAP